MSAPDPEDALALLHAFRVDTGPATRAVPWRSVATERQAEDARAVIMEPGSWHMWLRPRGGSKTQDASLVALACLLTIQPPNSRSLVYAVDKDQAALMMEKLGHLAKALPEDLRVTGDRVTNIATQAFLTVETSDAPSALGHTPWLVVVDEFCAWPDRRGPRLLWQAVVSSMPKRPDSRLLVISSAGDPGNWTHDVVRSARAGTDWRFSYMQGPCPWWSEVDVARQRGALSDAAYSWYILNEFAAAENALVGADDLTAAVARGVTSRPYDPAHRYAIGVDLGRKVDASVVAVAHREGDAVVVDHVERWLPTRLSPVRLETVEAAIRRLQAEYGHAHVRMDPAKGEMLSQRLGEDGLAVEEYVFSEASVDRLAALVSRLFGERRITVPDLPALVEELGTVVLRTTPGGRSRIDHHSGKHDDQVVAIALAAHWLMAQVSFGTGFVSNAREMVRGPRPRRDRTAVPARASVSAGGREAAAADRLARMVRRR